MSIGLKGNSDGSGAIQVGGSDAITITTGLAATFANNVTVTGTLSANGVTGSVYPVVSATAVPSTSGTTIDFTNIPSWVKRITVMFYGVSVSGTDTVLLRLGTGATPTYAATGYLTGNAVFNGASIGSFNNPTNGFAITAGGSAAALTHGSVVLTLVTGTLWTVSGSTMNSGSTRGVTTAGSLDAGAALTAIRIITETTNTFDAGSINILYE